jgi:hypothetical protein
MFPCKAPRAALARLFLSLALAIPARGAEGERSAASARLPDSCAPAVAEAAPPRVRPARPCAERAAADTAGIRAADGQAAAGRAAAPAADPCAPVRAARPQRAEAGDPFLAAVLGALPLASGFYVSDSPVKGAAFSLADLMLIGAIIQVRSDPDRPPKDAAAYYWLLAGVNLADAMLSVLQVRSDAARHLSVNVNPTDRPGFLLGWRF